MKIRLYYFYIVLGVTFLFPCASLPKYPNTFQIEFDDVFSGIWRMKFCRIL